MGACPALRPCSGSHSRPPMHCQVSAIGAGAQGPCPSSRDPRKPPTPANRSLPGPAPVVPSAAWAWPRPLPLPAVFRLGPICRTLECPAGAVSGFSLLTPPLTCRGTDPDCAGGNGDIARTVRQAQTRTKHELMEGIAGEDFCGWLMVWRIFCIRISPWLNEARRAPTTAFVRQHNRFQHVAYASTSSSRP